MRNAEVSRRLQRINSLIARTHELPSIEAQSHWARYLCVLIAGLIEKGFIEILSEFVNNTTPAPVANYAVDRLEQLQNPKTKKIIEVVGLFRDDWRDELQRFVENSGRKDAIDSIMANRHLIAHGDDSAITVARAKEWLHKAVDVLEFIENQCSPS